MFEIRFFGTVGGQLMIDHGQLGLKIQDPFPLRGLGGRDGLLGHRLRDARRRFALQPDDQVGNRSLQAHDLWMIRGVALQE